MHTHRLSVVSFCAVFLPPPSSAHLPFDSSASSVPLLLPLRHNQTVGCRKKSWFHNTTQTLEGRRMSLGIFEATPSSFSEHFLETWLLLWKAWSKRTACWGVVLDVHWRIVIWAEGLVAWLSTPWNYNRRPWQRYSLSVQSSHPSWLIVGSVKTR